jgi:hypothetical protein
MTDHLTTLRDRIAKTQAKVQRYKKSLESSEKELSDLAIALRVIEGIANDGEANGGGTSTTVGRQLEIVRLLGVGRENASPPADIYARYHAMGAEDISIDTFRTTIWRMKGKEFQVEGHSFMVHGDTAEGVYWKELDEFDQFLTQDTGAERAIDPPTPNPFDAFDDDSEIPF